MNQNNDLQAKIDQAIEEMGLASNLGNGGNGTDDPNADPQELELNDPQKTPPAVHDEQAFGGTNADLESDDDIDKVGKEYGVEYKEDEELNLENKVKVVTTDS